MEDKQHQRISKLLSYFKVEVDNFEFKGEVELDPDTKIYILEIDSGVLFNTFYIYEVDYIDSLKKIRHDLKENVGPVTKFIPVKKRITDFKAAKPVKAATKYKEPENWEKIAKYANDQDNSKPYYFSFLVEK